LINFFTFAFAILRHILDVIVRNNVTKHNLIWCCKK
jgi:hypothetical protein